MLAASLVRAQPASGVDMCHHIIAMRGCLANCIGLAISLADVCSSVQSAFGLALGCLPTDCTGLALALQLALYLADCAGLALGLASDPAFAGLLKPH